MNPRDAKRDMGSNVENTLSCEDVVMISETSSNDGVVLEGLGAGSVVVIAKYEKLIAYLEVSVSGIVNLNIPHIVTADTVVEVEVNKKKSISLNLQGGSIVDNANFIWTNSNANVANLETSTNVGVIEGLQIGSSVVTVKHPKAQYPVDIIVYCVGVDEIPYYITTGDNVVTINKDETVRDINVLLNGGNEIDKNSFQYSIKKGGEFITISGMRDVVSVQPLQEGIGIITVSHPKAEYALDIQVIVYSSKEDRYIEVSDNFITMNLVGSKFISANMVGSVPGDVIDKYSFEIFPAGIVEVVQSRNSFYITGKSGGAVILKVKNDYADFEREVLIMVDGSNGISVSNEKYIITSQNVVQMEVGGANTLLKMFLIGGVEADKNGFSWTVSDSSIIDVSSSFGEIKYTRKMKRSILDDESLKRLNAEAVITAKKPGTATITIANVNSQNNSTVLVKVYPRGTFSSEGIEIVNTGVYRVQVGEQKGILLQTTKSGNDIGELNWSIDDPSVAMVIGNGLQGVLEGLTNGITYITVKDGNLKHEFKQVLIVGDDAYVSSIKYFYIDGIYKNIGVGHSVAIGINEINLGASENTYTITNTAPHVAEAILIGKKIIVQGLQKGEAIITLRDSVVGITNDLIIKVDESNISIDTPYYITGDNYIGVVAGSSVQFRVNLVGANEAEKGKLVWKNDNGAIVDITGNGEEIRIEGKSFGQTKITVGHIKSENTKEIIVYVVHNEAELAGKIVLGIPQLHYLMRKGDTEYIKVVTNASDGEKKNIVWNIDTIGIVEFADTGYDFVGIRAVENGVAKVTVSHPDNHIPVTLFISVSSEIGTKDIMLPSIVEMIVGENKVIAAETFGIQRVEYYDFEWTIENSSIASIDGDGNRAYLIGKTSGQTFLTLNVPHLGYEKRVLLVCAGSPEELEYAYVMSVDTSYYRIKTNSERTIMLVFGSAGFPETDKQLIAWRTENNSVASVLGNGDQAVVKAKNEGITKVIAESSRSLNSVEITIEVYNDSIDESGYHFVYNALQGVIIGETVTIPISLYNGSTLVTGNTESISYENEKSDVIEMMGSGTILRARGLREGISYITVRHPLVLEASRILVYVVQDEQSLDTAFPLALKKANYLLQVNEAADVFIETVSDDPAKLAGIQWSTDNSTIEIIEKNKKEITIIGKAVGNAIVNVTYNNTVAGTVYISVKQPISSDNTAAIITESIIGLVKGEVKRINLKTNLNDQDAHNIQFTADKPNMVYINTDGANTSVQGLDIGETVVHVRYGNIDKHILVYVCDTQEEVDAYHAFNSADRYYFLGIHEETTVSYFGKNINVNNTTWTDVYQNNVVSYTVQGNAGQFKGVHEGVALVEITNTQCTTPLHIYIEVSKKYNGKVTENTALNYLTTDNTLIVMKSDDKNVPIMLDVIGNYYDAIGKFEWKNNDPSIISLNTYDKDATVTPKVKEGTASITVSNPRCNNIITIHILIGDRYYTESAVYPYIYAAQAVYSLKTTDDPIVVNYEVRNVPNVNYSDITIAQTGDSIRYDVVDNKIIITPKVKGNTVLTVSYTGGAVENLTLYFLVGTEIEGSITYLTTANNVNIMSIGENKNITVDLIGYNEVNANNFVWSTNDTSIVKIIGSGPNVQLLGLREGNATVKVQHSRAQFDLEILVKVVKDNYKESIVYLTTTENVIETVISSQSSVINVNKIGGSGYNNYSWTVDDPTILSLVASGETGSYYGKKEGIAKIQVTDIEADYPLQIVIVVKKPLPNSVVIQSESNLITLSPGTVNHKINVTLDEGDAGSYNKFSFSVYSQKLYDANLEKSGGNVVSISYGGNECIINALNEGTARIRVDHPSAQLPYYVVVYVTEYSGISFIENSFEVVAGESEFVAIRMPTYEDFVNKIRYTSDNEEVVTVWGTNKVVLLSGIKKGNAIITATIDGTDFKDELYVNVLAADEMPETRIIAPKTTFAFNPRSDSINVTAYLQGRNIIDLDDSELRELNDTIRWEVTDPKVVSIFPNIGREVLLSPKGLGETTIIIRHPVARYAKVLSVMVSEPSDSFTIDKTSLVMNENGNERLSVNILNGKNADYAAVQWMATQRRMPDGTMVEVVKVLGNGQNVQVLAVGTGECEIFAFWKGKPRVVCNVTVNASKVFEIETRNLYIYPGQVRRVKYTVKPFNANIQWFETFQTDADENDPKVAFKFLDATHEIVVEGIKEGEAYLKGVGNGKKVELNVFVRYNYNMMIHESSKDLVPHVKIPVEYSIYPHDNTLQVTTQSGNLAIDIETANLESGKGIIYFTANREFEEEMVVFTQHKKDGTPINNTTSPQTIKLISMYPAEEQAAVVVKFLRYDGVQSNSYGLTENGKRNVASYQGGKEALQRSGQNYTLDLYDGETHYIIFDREGGHDDSYMSALKNPAVTGAGFTAEVGTLQDGAKTIQVIKITGEKDYISYNRFGTEYEPYVSLRMDHPGDHSKDLIPGVHRDSVHWSSQMWHFDDVEGSTKKMRDWKSKDVENFHSTYNYSYWNRWFTKVNDYSYTTKSVLVVPYKVWVDDQSIWRYDVYNGSYWGTNLLHDGTNFLGQPGSVYYPFYTGFSLYTSGMEDSETMYLWDFSVHNTGRKADFDPTTYLGKTNYYNGAAQTVLYGTSALGTSDSPFIKIQRSISGRTYDYYRVTSYTSLGGWYSATLYEYGDRRTLGRPATVNGKKYTDSRYFPLSGTYDGGNIRLIGYGHTTTIDNEDNYYLSWGSGTKTSKISSSDITPLRYYIGWTDQIQNSGTSSTDLTVDFWNFGSGGMSKQKNVEASLSKGLDGITVIDKASNLFDRDGPVKLYNYDDSINYTGWWNQDEGADYQRRLYFPYLEIGGLKFRKVSPARHTFYDISVFEEFPFKYAAKDKAFITYNTTGEYPVDGAGDKDLAELWYPMPTNKQTLLPAVEADKRGGQISVEYDTMLSKGTKVTIRVNKIIDGAHHNFKWWIKDSAGNPAYPEVRGKQNTWAEVDAGDSETEIPNLVME
jgi:hypothetical protein